MRVARLVSVALGVAGTAPTAFGQGAAQFRADFWSTEDGLPSTALSSVVQTGDGFLWIAAGGSLVRFDGFDFKVYNTATNPVLRDRVNQLYAGVGDTVWIGLNDGTVVSHARGQFAELGPLPGRWLFGLVQDRQGELIAVGLGQLLRWRGDRFQPVDLPEDWTPSAMPKRDGAGDAWFHGLNGDVVRVAAHEAERVGRTDAPTLVAYPARGQVLRMSRNGAHAEFSDGSGVVVARYHWLPGLRPLLIDRRGRLWAYGQDDLLVYSGSQPEPIARVPLGEGFSFGSIIEDRSGNLWTAGIGLVRIQELPFRTVTRAPQLVGTNRQVKALSQGPPGSILAEVELDVPGVFQLDGERAERIASGFASGWTDARGTTWLTGIGPIPDRLVGRREGQPEIILARRARRPLLIAADPVRVGSFWFAGDSAIYLTDPYTDHGPQVTDSLVFDGMLRVLAVDPGGTLWFLSADSAGPQLLSRFRRGSLQRWSAREGLPVTMVRALLADTDGTLWLGTYGGGLVRFAHDRFQTIAPEHGLAENVVSCILDDGAGNLWMAGNRGVHRVRRDDATAFLEGNVRRVAGIAYGRGEGLTDPETTGDACVRSSDGRLWFPTFGGAAVVDPARALVLDSTPPRVHVLGIQTTGDTLLPPETTRLSRGQRRLSIRYTGVSLRNPSGVRFEYRLDGVDTEWIHAGSGRVATYNNVGPGQHTFRVRAMSAGAAWSPSEATLTFAVPAYFHETIPFYALVIGLMALGAHLLWRMRTAQLQRRQVELVALVNARTAELARTLSVVENQASQLRTLDEAKSRFFANVSHEFRTPLTLILGPVEDVRDGRNGPIPDAVRKHLNTVLTNGRRLAHLVEQLLDVARLESGTLTLQSEIRDLVPLLRRMTESFASLATRRGIGFRVSLPVGGLRVRHDPDQMEKVIGNLLGNALKFTPAGGAVELRALVEGDGQGGWAVVAVEDNGPGIPAAHQSRVFDRFYQVDDTSRRVHEGAGIGLALARELVDLHGGTLHVDSSEGVGSTFFVRLPLIAGDAAVAGHSGEHVSVAETRSVPSAQASRNEPVARIRARHRTSDDVTTVLVAEDNADLLEYLKDHLADHYRVLTADNGATALASARAHVPDLIISDVMMPELDGQALCDAVKRDPETDFIPVILLTAKASRESRLAGLEGGADDYLAKPVDMPELLIRAANLIASRRRLKERWGAERRPLPLLSPHASAPDSGSEAFLKTPTPL
jgi:signal transduction histidine kinase/CheY-like chemotaxis protein/ligand-binding sensor domain-containing protein